MSTYSQTLTSHGDILANIPGILGFYPQNSLVLAFFERNDDTPGLHLGPLARLDLDDTVQTLTANQQQFTALSDRDNTDAIIAYVISADPSAADDLANFLLSEDSPLPTVLAIIQVPEITSGTGWWTVYQQLSLSAPRTGVVSEVAGSLTLQQMILDTGQLPALSREELEERLNSTAHGQTYNNIKHRIAERGRAGERYSGKRKSRSAQRGRFIGSGFSCARCRGPSVSGRIVPCKAKSMPTPASTVEATNSPGPW